MIVCIIAKPDLIRYSISLEVIMTESAAEPLQLRLHTSAIHCQLTALRQVKLAVHLPSTAKRFLFKQAYPDIIY